MDDKFSVNLRDYTTVPCECTDCHVHYSLRLRRDHSALASKVEDRILIRCPECCRAKRLSGDNFEIKARPEK